MEEFKISRKIIWFPNSCLEIGLSSSISTRSILIHLIKNKESMLFGLLNVASNPATHRPFRFHFSKQHNVIFA